MDASLPTCGTCSGLYMTTTRLTWGATCLSTSSNLPLIVNSPRAKPVILPGPGKTGNEAAAYGIGDCQEDNGNGARLLLQCDHWKWAHAYDDVGFSSMSSAAALLMRLTSAPTQRDSI